MNYSIKTTLKKYKNFLDTYTYAFIGFPKGFSNIKEDFYGTFDEFNKKYPNIKFDDKSYPTILYVHGSAGLSRGKVFRKYIVENLGYIFFSPNSFKIQNRPVYKSPTKISNYNKVHKLRIAEVNFNHKKLKKLSFIDKNNLFLMGNSEGAVTASMYKSNAFKGRIATAFSCENSYYINHFKLGCSKKTPFLNIIGTHDEYFSKNTPFNKNITIHGNGIKQLKNYKNAKIVILPKTKHDLTHNIYLKDELLNFLKLWTNTQ